MYKTNDYPVVLDINETMPIESLIIKPRQKIKIKLKYPCYIYDAEHNLKNIIKEIDWTKRRRMFGVRI